LTVVYISSTYEDLKEERMAAISAVSSLGLGVKCMEDYGAAEVRPLDQCLEDVRNCQAFIGIIGLKYGSIVRGNRGKSFTQLEYEEAGRRGIDRCMFLCPDAGEGPPRPRDTDSSRIDAFRALVREDKLLGTFDDPESLRKAIMASEIRTLKPTPGALLGLVKQCDRVPQRSALSRALRKTLSVDNTRAQVCVIQGEEQQLLDEFVTRIVGELLPLQLHLPQEPEAVFRVDLDWPSATDAEGFVDDLRWNLVQKTAYGTDDSLDDVATWIARRRMPVLVTVPLRTDAWSRKTASAVERSIDMFANWSLPRLAYPVVVVFKVNYRVGEAGWFRRRAVRKGHAAIRRHLEDLRVRQEDIPNIEYLPVLEDVVREDAEEWATRGEVLAHVDAASLAPEIRAAFRDRPALPMGQALDKLRAAVARAHCRHRKQEKPW